MTQFDNKSEDPSLEWAAIRQGLEPFFQNIAAHCPYGLDGKAVYHQSFLGRLPDAVFGAFLAEGFRRNGNYLYSMECEGCRACVPIRLVPEDFRPNRSQRRIWKRNQDLTVEIGPLEVSTEKLAMCQTFLNERYPRKENVAQGYYSGFFLNSMTNTVEFRYLAGKRLLGVAIVDLADTWLNAVYFYFDPDEGRRSLGTYNILRLIDFCRGNNVPLLYLGYWIAGVSAMSYKKHFRPHWLLGDEGWVCSGPR